MAPTEKEDPITLFRDLKRHYPRAEVEDYFKDGRWLMETLEVDLELVVHHRREAGAPDPVPLEEVPVPELPRSAGSMGPRLPPGPPPERLLRRAAAASAATGAPRQGADAAATPPPSTKQIEAFASRWRLEQHRTKLALAKVSADMRRHVIDSFTFRPVAGQSPDAALEQYIAREARAAPRQRPPPAERQQRRPPPERARPPPPSPPKRAANGDADGEPAAKRPRPGAIGAPGPRQPASPKHRPPPQPDGPPPGDRRAAARSPQRVPRSPARRPPAAAAPRSPARRPPPTLPPRRSPARRPSPPRQPPARRPPPASAEPARSAPRAGGTGQVSQELTSKAPSRARAPAPRPAPTNSKPLETFSAQPGDLIKSLLG